MPANLQLLVVHSGLYANGRPNTASILIDDVTDLGQTPYQQKQPVYVPAGGFVALELSSSVLASYTQGSISKLQADGLVTVTVVPASAGISSGTPTALINNDNTEQTLFSLAIPAYSWNLGDLIMLRSSNEVTQYTSGELRMRVWWNTVGVTPLITGFFNRSSTGLTGFEYSWFMVTGTDPAAARLVGADFTGINVSPVDLTVDNVVNFTGQMTIADPANEYRGLGAFLGKV